MKKSMVNNYVYNLIYTLINVIFPLITVPYLSRVLLVEGVGKVSFAYNIVSYFIVIASLGIPYYGIREIAKINDRYEERSKIFSELFYINLISTSVCTAGYYTMVNSVSYFSEQRTLYNIVGLVLVLNLLDVDWLYRGLEEYRYIATRSVLTKMISLIMMFIFVRTPKDYIIYAFIQGLAVTGNYIFNVVHLRKVISLRIRGINVRRHLRSVVILISTQIAVQLYAQMDTTMIGLISGNSHVGYYANVVKLIRVLVMVITGVGTILLPRLSYYYQNNMNDDFSKYINSALKTLISVSFPLSLGCLLISKDIVLVYLGQAFSPAIITLEILSPLIVILSIGNLFGTQILMIVNQETKLLRSVLIGTFVNLALNFYLIRMYQQNGAALASVIAEVCVMIVQIIYSTSYVKITLPIRYLYKPLLSSSALVIVVTLIEKIGLLPLYSIILSTTVGTLVFIGVSILVRDEVIYKIKEALPIKYAR